MNTNQQKLNELYSATRYAPLSAEVHEKLKQLATEIFEALSDKKEEPTRDGKK